MSNECEILVHAVLSYAKDGFTHLKRPLQLPNDDRTIEKAMQEAYVSDTKRPFTACGFNFASLTALNGKINENQPLEKLNSFARYLSTLTESERTVLTRYANRRSALTPIECMTETPCFLETGEITVAVYATVFSTQPGVGYLQLPATAEEFADAFDRGRCAGSFFYVEVLTSKHSYIRDALRECPYEDLRKLNALAKRLSELDDPEHFILRAMIQMEKNPPNAARIINLSHNLQNCVLAPAKNLDELGRFAVEGSFYPEYDAIPDEMLHTLDYEKIGQRFMDEQNGVILDGTFVANLDDKDETQTPYNSNPPILDFDSDHVFRLHVATLPESSEEIWMDLPASQYDMTQIAKRLGRENLDGCGFISCRSAIPQIDRILTGRECIFELNDFAEELRYGQNADALSKYKAVLEYERCASFEDCVAALGHLDRYDFRSEMVSTFDVGEMRMIEQYGMNRFSEGMKHFDFAAYGEEWMEQEGIVNTPYGMVGKAGLMPTEGQSPEFPISL